MRLTEKNIKTIVENVLLLEDMSDGEAIKTLEDELEVEKGVIPVVEFLNSKEGRDPKVRDFLDDSPNSDSITVSDGNEKCKKYSPTQSQISLKKSVGWPLSNFGSCKAISSGDPTGGHGNEPSEDGIVPPNRIVVSGNVIIDGHHRWSQVFSIGGPENDLLIKDIALPGKDAGEKLAAAHVGIVATMQSTDLVPSEDEQITDNVLGESKATIKEMIISQVGQPMESGKPLLGDDWCNEAKSSEIGQGFFDIDASMDNETVRETVTEKVATNLAALPKQAQGSPPRNKMPQFDLKTDPEDVFDNFSQGKVNFRNPFGEANESINLDRWNKLAGLLKG